MYGWIDSCFTKFHLLDPTLTLKSCGKVFDKIAFLDADMIASSPQVDEIFNVSTPAGVCSIIPLVEEESRHGQHLDSKIVETAIRTDYGIRGGTLLLTPSQEQFTCLMSRLKPTDTAGTASTAGTAGTAGTDAVIGDTVLFIGPDERLLSEFYLNDWHHLHRKFGCTSWKTTGVNSPVFLHFVTEKPWNGRVEWEDFKLWNIIAKEVVETNVELFSLFFPQHVSSRDAGRNSDSSNSNNNGISNNNNNGNGSEKRANDTEDESKEIKKMRL